MWIGKLFGVLCLSLHFQYQSMPEFANHENMAQGYGEKINQCLLLGKYQDCPPDTIEALCFSLNAQVLRSGNTCMDSLVFLGMIVRMAQRMGYHRDASHFPEISPFDGEMRRRVWSQITDLDTLVSAQVGLPRILRESQSDTAPPQNLLDEDFDEHIEKLPPPRPDSFETPSQWMVAKNRMISMFGVITDLSTSIKRSDYSEVMRLDKSLRETYSSSPEILLEKPMSRSLMDNSRIILHRIQLILLREKALCVLHYRHLASARTEERYEYSRKTCIESSLRMLEYQWIVETETQPGGRLFEQRWKLTTLLFKNQWILSTSLLCLELNYDISEESKDNSKYIPLSESIKEQIIQSLRRSYQIFSHSGDDSEGFVKAMQAFSAVFQKVDDQERGPTIDSDEKAVHETDNTFGPSPISGTQRFFSFFFLRSTDFRADY